MEAEQTNLNPVIIQDLSVEHTRTSPPTSDVQLSPTLPETPSEPRSYLWSLSVNGQVICPRKSNTTRSGLAQLPTLPNDMVQPMDMGLTLGPELTIDSEHSLALQGVASLPQKNPGLTLAHPDQVQAQHPKLTTIRVQLLDVDCSMIPAPAKELNFLQ